MKLLTNILLSFAFAVCVGGSPALHSPKEVHERRAHTPFGWEPARRLDSSTNLPVRIGLKQSNIERLEELLMDVSHPHSPNYGNHYTAEQVKEMFKPPQESVDAVMDWLESEGIDRGRMKLSNSGGWVEVNLSVDEAERVLDAEYMVYQHTYGSEHVACDSYSLPAHIRPHVDIVLPSVNFDARVAPKGHPASPARRAERLAKRSVPDGNSLSGTPKAHIHPFVKTEGAKSKGHKDPNDLANCDQEITPACLRALYNFNDVKLVSTNKNSYGIVEYSPQAFIQSDLNMFFKNFSPATQGRSPSLVSIDGGIPQHINESFDFNGESDLDLEYSMALVFPQQVTLYQTGDLVEGASFNNLLDALDASYCTFEGGDDPEFDGIYPDTQPGGFDKPESCGIVKPANVISTSFGSQEPEMTAAYEIRQCNEYGKLGLMGVTILYSSGDNGVAGFDGFCIDPATGMETPNGTRFDPDFPANCPFVTAVGATQINPGGTSVIYAGQGFDTWLTFQIATVNDPEGACEQVIFSGGGFSDIFPIPQYQQAAVTEFLTNHPPPFTAAQFNNSGKARGYPDLAANGANYVIALDGEFVLVFGTSCSSPVVGSMITAINDARLAAGKKPVGFINPTIYLPEFRAGFNDITMGGNQGCGTPGFTATEGWDPVTGLGTPNFGKLRELFLSLP